MTLSDHIVSIIHLKFVFSFQVNGDILLVRKPFLTHRAFEPVLNPTLEPHVSVEIVVPVVGLPALLTLEGLLSSRLLLVPVSAGTDPGLVLGLQLSLGRAGGGGRGGGVREGERELREEE